jgi:hypothetical protein
MALRSNTEPADLLTKAPFGDMLSELDEKLQASLKPADSENKQTEPPETPTTGNASGELQLVTLLSPTQLKAEDSTKVQLENWFDEAVQFVNKFVKLVTEKLSTADMSDMLKATQLNGTLRPDLNAIFWYDTGTAGEASCQPHCRMPLFRSAHLKKMLQAYVAARGNDRGC